MRKKDPLEAEIHSEKKLYSANGLVMAELLLALPVYRGGCAPHLEKETAALKKEMERIAASLAADAEREYRENTDPRRRFTHRPYRVEYRGAVCMTGEKYLSLSYIFSVSRGGKMRCRLLFGDTFLRKNGKRVPLFAFMDRKERKKQGAGLFASYTLDEKGIPRLLHS